SVRRGPARAAPIRFRACGPIPLGPVLILARQAAQTFRGGLVIPQRILLGGQSAPHAGLVLLLLSDTRLVRGLLPVLGRVREVGGVGVDGHGGDSPGWLILWSDQMTEGHPILPPPPAGRPRPIPPRKRASGRGRTG